MVQERIANCNDAQNVDVPVPQILEASVQTIQLQHVESDFLKMDQIVAQARISVDEPVLEVVQTIAQELISMSNVDDQSVDDTQSLSLFVSRIEEDIGKIIQQVPLTTEEIRKAFQQAHQECRHECRRQNEFQFKKRASCKAKTGRSI